MKIGRNDPCHCGSGKKYKKCCLLVEEAASRVSSIESYDPVEVIKALALLQLIPENHGKNLRIEIALAEMMKNYKSSHIESSRVEINSSELLKTLNKKFPRDYREDPAENSFTDNIMFGGKNYTVFPGVMEEGPQVVQSLLDAIFRMDNDLIEEFKYDIYNGVTFILEIHQLICDELEYKRYEFRDQVEDDLHFNGKLDFDNSQLIEFNQDELAEICNEFNLNIDILEEFIVRVKDYKFNASNINSNELLFKPFVSIESTETYILATPSAELSVINEYILRKAYEHNCLDALISVYKKTVYSDCLQILDNINFQMTDIGLAERDVFSPPYITVFQFDANKFALVVLLDNMGDGNPKNIGKINFPRKDIETAVNQIRSVAPNHKIHLIGIASKIAAMTGYMYVDDPIKNIDQFTMLSPFDLKCITTLWKCDQLTLWKFQKAKNRAESKIRIMPGFKNLTYFNWYKNNLESFFHTDDHFDFISYDYYEQAELIRKANLTLDLHLAYKVVNEKVIGIPVKKKEEGLPLYSLTRPSSDETVSLLEIYDFPIWVSCKSDYYPLGEGFMGAVTYWLTEMHSSISDKLNLLTPYPLSIVLDFDPEFINHGESNGNQTKALTYELDTYLRSITVFIPYSFKEKVTNTNNNEAEKILIGCILKGIFELIADKTDQNFSTDSELRLYVNNILANPNQRMIIPISTDLPIQINTTQTVGKRQVQEADIAFIREEILNWAGLKDLKHIKSKKDKTGLCNKLVVVLIDKFRDTVKEFNSLQLLELAMIRHESMIFYSAYAEESLGPKMNCFNKYQNVVEEYRKDVSKNVPSVLAYRCMIELIMAEPPKGTAIVNSDDMDYLHALTEQIINFGNLSDVINEEFSATEITKLASGRIGIDHSFFNNELRDFSVSYLNNEINDKFSRKPSLDITTSQEDYENSVDEVFKKEWGIGLFQISEVCSFLSLYTIYERERSFMMLTEEEFMTLFDKLPFTKEEIVAFCEQMTLKSRGDINKLPEGSKYRQEEIYLWRYNRQLSYIRKPLLEVVDDDGVKSFIWSPRHLDMASENIRAIFHNGTLKVENQHKNIQSLLAKRNHINGRKFREEVYNWLINNTDLDVIPYEVPISPKHILKSETNLGDIDIMAVDREKKIVLLLELKNTKQAKNTYDFKRDIENYLDSLIPKHDKRVKWILENKNLLAKFLKHEIDDYEIFSCIISSATLPLKYMDKSPMPIYAFSEIKSDGIDEILSSLLLNK